ncbi:class I SAM-dependent DNA methyltransferase [Ferruginibacter yonginensis]|uniref:Class I SAM-dependent DNA methyltransferase n=1 Tax=Ferruginibacter yonginensis TaxID=1310416 RepID=A0ABV8QUD5_9BACT
MDSYKETFETWNKVATLYQEKFMELDIYNATYDFICKTIAKPNAKLLDVGCGPGNISKYILTQRPDVDILGIDMAPNMIALAKQNNPTANFSVLDIRKINTLNSMYDGIICGFSLPYISYSDCENFLKDAYALLHNEALIYISFIEGKHSNSGFKVASTGDRSYFYYYELAYLKERLTENKFHDFNVFKILYQNKETHTIITAKK